MTPSPKVGLTASFPGRRPPRKIAKETSMAGGLPDGLSRRQFLEDVLDAMGDVEAIDLGDGTEIHRTELWRELAKELDRSADD